MKRLFILLLVVVTALAASEPLTLFTAAETEHYGARCLDGSPAGYYLYKTSNAAYKNNWVIWLEGGGWCFPNSSYPNVDNCYSRAKTNLGSSKYWPATMNIGFYRDYNYVYVIYCSGDFHSGTRNETVGGLYYSGHLIVQGVIGKLKQIDTLSQAQLVVFTGGSAGGLGVIVNFDYVRTQLSSSTTLKVWPSAGWFPQNIIPIPSNYISLDASMKQLYSQVNPYLNTACKAAYTSSPWSCYSGTNVFPFVGDLPFFVTQSLFDQWAQGFNGVTDLTSPNNVKFMSHFGQAARNSFAKAQQGPSYTGLFLVTDSVHEFETDYGRTINGVTLQTIISNWLDGLSLTKEISNCTYVGCAVAPYKGCWIDGTTRDLPFTGPQGATTTIELCQTFCKQNNYVYAGLQNGNECRCGASYGRYGPDLSACNMNCAGNAYEFCGQSYHNDIYSVS